MPADSDIAEYLEDLTYGTVGTDIFAGYLPDEPDAAIAVVLMSGTAPEPVIDFEHPSIEIAVRDAAYADARSTAMDILHDLHQITHQTIETRDYRRIDAQGSVGDAERDSKNRTIFRLRFAITKAIE